MLTLNSSQSVKHTLFGNIYAVIQQQKRVQQTTALIPVASDLLTGLLLPTIGEAKDATRTAMTSYRSIVMCIAVVMVVAVALTGTTLAAGNPAVGSAPFRTLKTDAVVVPDQENLKDFCPPIVPSPTDTAVEAIKKTCKKGATDAETCARCTCGVAGLAAYPQKMDTATSMYFDKFSSLNDAGDTACSKVLLKRAGMPDDIINVVAPTTCNWDVARAQPACQEAVLQVTGCKAPAQAVVDAIKTNCSAADATTAKASCLNCKCTEFNIHYSNLGKSGFVPQCLYPTTLTLFSKAMLDARGAPPKGEAQCQVSDADRASKCPWTVPAAKSGAGNVVGMPVGALAAVVLLLLALL